MYIDSAWGRFEGLPAIEQFMVDSMEGLGDWRFPEKWAMAEGDRVVSMWWNLLSSRRPDGSPYRVAGISILRYAGDGKFDYEYDVFNMQQILEVIAESGWTPTGPMNAPPDPPIRARPHHRVQTVDDPEARELGESSRVRPPTSREPHCSSVVGSCRLSTLPTSLRGSEEIDRNRRGPCREPGARGRGV